MKKKKKGGEYIMSTIKVHYEAIMAKEMQDSTRLDKQINEKDVESHLNHLLFEKKSERKTGLFSNCFSINRYKQTNYYLKP